MTASSGFYAVAKGRIPGVFTSWDECKEQVTGFPGAIHKKFKTLLEAQEFIRINNPHAPVVLHPPHAPAVLPQPHAPAVLPPPHVPAVLHAPHAPAIPHPPQQWQQPAAPKPAPIPQLQQQCQGGTGGYGGTRGAGLPSDPDPQRDREMLVAFCDGSAVNNGQANCRSGWACVFPHNPEWDRAEALEGPGTNNRAEYTAALEAMRRANAQDPSGSRPLFIYTDSALLISSMTQWVSTWSRNQWVKADGAAVRNRDLLEQLLREQGVRGVVWRHVRAHTGGQDWESVWNDRADVMARGAAVRGRVEQQVGAGAGAL